LGSGDDELMAQIKSWTVSDALWSKVEPLIPARAREAGRKYQRKAGAGRKPMVFTAGLCGDCLRSAHGHSMESIAARVWFC
jgi:hypothetical protein